MPAIDLVVESALDPTTRVRQVCSLFDVPLPASSRLEWHGAAPIEDAPWSVGLIVGPSGAGKSSIARHLFGERPSFAWTDRAVVDDLPGTLNDVGAVCQAVGFNTIPAWLRPHAVLSTGEKFRVEMARHLLGSESLIVMDEFTSVVDRQIAKIGSHAIQKFMRKTSRQFVAVSCHYDIVDWLQPDWVLEPALMRFERRVLLQRPRFNCEIAAVDRKAAWPLFAPYHYLTAELHTAARCYVLFVDDQPAAFAGLLYRPHPKARGIWGVSRLVTLPDWQGMGLAMALVDALGAAHAAAGLRLHTYPAHPALVRVFDRSTAWAMHKRAGVIQNRAMSGPLLMGGGRPNAVFEYVGPAASDASLIAA